MVINYNITYYTIMNTDMYTNMNTNIENCQIIKELFDNENEQEGMIKVGELMNSYMNEYSKEIKNHNIININKYRTDTKGIFNTLHYIFSNETVLKEMSFDADNDTEMDIKEKTEYFNFVNNIEYILKHIDTVNIDNPGEEFTINCSNAINFMNQKNIEAESLKKTMNTLATKLNDVAQTLSNIVTN